MGQADRAVAPPSGAKAKMKHYNGSTAELHFVVAKNARNFDRGYYREMSLYLMSTRFTREQILELKRIKFGRKKEHSRHSEIVSETLLDWFEEHSDHPYPTNAEKEELQLATGLSRQQVIDWFVNQRKRHWCPPERKSRQNASLKPGHPVTKKISGQVNRSLNPTHPKTKVSDQFNRPLDSTHSEKKIKISEQPSCPESDRDSVMHSLHATGPGVVPDAFLPPSIAAIAFLPTSIADALLPLSIAPGALFRPSIAPDALYQSITPDVLYQSIATDALYQSIAPDTLYQSIAQDLDAFSSPLEDQNFDASVEAGGCALDDVTHGAFMFNGFEQTADEPMPPHDHAATWDEATWENFLNTFIEDI